MSITAPLKLPNSFVHLERDAMLRSDMEKGRLVAYLKGVVHYTVRGVSSSIKMTDQNKERLFDACRSGDIDTVRRIVGRDPNSVHWTRGWGWNGTPLHKACE